MSSCFHSSLVLAIASNMSGINYLKSILPCRIDPNAKFVSATTEALSETFWYFLGAVDFARHRISHPWRRGNLKMLALAFDDAIENALLH